MTPAARSAGFRVVGIGCSAGGLEALQKFFSQVPANCGMAFIVVQHLLPRHLSSLPQLLRHVTRMPVAEARQGTVVRADCVYVIPPDRILMLQHGRLMLEEQATSPAARTPIDHFLRSLADDKRDAAVGIVLSGMGSDGVAGLAAVRARGGATLVQTPATAQADGMPSAALKAGVADIVAPAEQLFGRLLDSPLHALAPSAPQPPADAADATDKSITSATQGALDEISALLRASSGTDFSLYKTNTLQRRIERRLAVRQVSDGHAYARLLRAEPHELELLFKELLIGVTSFFRDGAVWDALRDNTLPALMAQHPQGRAMRAWVPACSTGEEAYSLAIVFAEALERLHPRGRFTLQIFATDLDPEAIEFARKGLYPKTIAADVSPDRLARFFSIEGDAYRVHKSVRESVVFATQNIAADPPFTRLDLLSCRNLLIYFGNTLQKKMLPLFHYALHPGGVLVLGSAETIGNFGRLFTPLHPKARIFQRNPVAALMSDLEFNVRGTPSANAAQAVPDDAAEHIGQLTDQLVQQTWAPAAVLVNADGDIVYISGRTGKYLEPAVGKANINLHAMARDGLREALVGMVRKALKDRIPILLPSLRVDTNGGTQLVDVTLQALDKPEPLRGHVIIVFKDVASAPARRKRSAPGAPATQDALAEELLQAREAMQVTHEEMQTVMEELKSSNEELQSTNEELQSTNEELTTSKEELQSLNEELQTVNAELQSKVDDLTWVRNDMSNLLNSTEIATVFLDNQMHLRRFTTHATRMFRMIQGDIGRPLAHVLSDLDYPGLVPDAQEVLRTLVFKESVAPTGDGRWYRVRAMPYRTHDNVIDGVVITFTDITEIKLLEAELRKPRR